jgi:acetyltransferase-like isoleucine patch superfamily enzyme|tara:strand:+ start:69 stop:662 length:594 start_codon:yes stop_codon:yes gene_type:complete
MYISRRFKLIFIIYSFYLKFFLKKSGKKNYISPLAQLVGKKNISISNNMRIGSHSRIEAEKGSVTIGDNCQIYRFSQILTYKAQITIGSFNSIHPYVSITGPGNINIGSYVRIAPGAVIVAGSHVFEDPSKPIHHQGMKSKGIIIEDDVWIGAKATILDGVTIAKGTVVGTNAVVTKSTKPYEIYVGVPAKSIGKRS